MIILDKQAFQEKVFNYEASKEWKFEGTSPAIIDFYAEWCGPCKTLGPILEQISRDYEGLIDVYKINVDTEQELATTFGVSSVPTMLFIPMEGKPHIAQGLLPAQAIRDAIRDIFKVSMSA